ncbi:hypothetical protein LCGC14_0388160 [marine sediment metagenome]|uniref:Uncharacterized protein n=1 Tax=marine sediment metagenome TaxID=412755 RepID=A0A0F9T5V2_9ZZZZ
MICACRYCDNEVFPPKTKFCSPGCSNRERALIVSEKGKLKPNPNQVYIEPDYSSKEAVKHSTDSGSWATMGVNSSIEAMEEVHEMFKG